MQEITQLTFWISNVRWHMGCTQNATDFININFT